MILLFNLLKSLNVGGMYLRVSSKKSFIDLIGIDLKFAILILVEGTKVKLVSRS